MHIHTYIYSYFPSHDQASSSAILSGQRLDRKKSQGCGHKFMHVCFRSMTPCEDAYMNVWIHRLNI